MTTRKQAKRCVNITRSKKKTPTNITKPQNTHAANTNNKRMKCVDITRSKTRAATNFRISVKNTERKNKQLDAPTKSIRSDEGLALETSASESLYGGQFTLSTQLIKPNYLVILPLTQHNSFFRNLPPLARKGV